MSHYAVSRVRIKNPDPDLLRQALNAIARKLGGTVKENTVVHGWGFSRRVQFLVAVNLPYGNGYGIVITPEGELRVHVDDHGAPWTAEQFATELLTEYTKLALQQSLAELGYSVEVVEENEEQVMLVATEGSGWGW